MNRARSLRPRIACRFPADWRRSSSQGRRSSSRCCVGFRFPGTATGRRAGCPSACAGGSGRFFVSGTAWKEAH